MNESAVDEVGRDLFEGERAGGGLEAAAACLTAVELALDALLVIRLAILRLRGRGASEQREDSPPEHFALSLSLGFATLEKTAPPWRPPQSSKHALDHLLNRCSLSRPLRLRLLMTVIEANNVAEWNAALRAAKAQGKTVIVDAYAASPSLLLFYNSDTSTLAGLRTLLPRVVTMQTPADRWNCVYPNRPGAALARRSRPYLTSSPKPSTGSRSSASTSTSVPILQPNTRSRLCRPSLPSATVKSSRRSVPSLLLLDSPP